jgi:hypothetical protein
VDYKQTLQLPRTEFPRRADLVAREPRRLAHWDQLGLYRVIQARRADAALVRVECSQCQRERVRASFGPHPLRHELRYVPQ